MHYGVAWEIFRELCHHRVLNQKKNAGEGQKVAILKAILQAM